MATCMSSLNNTFLHFYIMKLKYKNYLIEDDRNWFILREIQIKEKGNNIWEEYEAKEFISNITL